MKKGILLCITSSLTFASIAMEQSTTTIDSSLKEKRFAYFRDCFKRMDEAFDTSPFDKNIFSHAMLILQNNHEDPAIKTLWTLYHVKILAKAKIEKNRVTRQWETTRSQEIRKATMDMTKTHQQLAPANEAIIQLKKLDQVLMKLQSPKKIIQVANDLTIEDTPMKNTPSEIRWRPQ